MTTHDREPTQKQPGRSRAWNRAGYIVAAAIVLVAAIVIAIFVWLDRAGLNDPSDNDRPPPSFLPTYPASSTR